MNTTLSTERMVPPTARHGGLSNDNEHGANETRSRPTSAIGVLYVYRIDHTKNEGLCMKFLVTGAAGFIGAAMAKRLCGEGHEVVGIDNLNDYYAVSLKKDRLEAIADPAFRFIRLDFSDRKGVADLFARENFRRVIHLGAQAGVRHSLENPLAYIDSNLLGQANILEGCRHHGVEHLVYASSSSVYGLNRKMPLQTSDTVDHPISLYAATKKADELMSHAYAHLYHLPTTGLRFFTVYGPWGRPDMAPIKFTRRIVAGEAIDVYNHGEMSRDFTYIDDIVEGVFLAQQNIPRPDPRWTVESGGVSRSSAPYRIYNIGNGSPVALLDFIAALEKRLGRVAAKRFMDMQPGDVQHTWADTEDLFEATGYRPKVGLEEGVARFIDWYRSYYGE